jgi:hypothetical protein
LDESDESHIVFRCFCCSIHDPCALRMGVAESVDRENEAVGIAAADEARVVDFPTSGRRIADSASIVIAEASICP